MQRRDDPPSRRALVRGLAGVGALSGLGALLATPSVAAAGEAVAGGAVDVALVMAIDASGSITGQDLDFQRRGHAAAFRDPAVRQAVAAGPQGRIAVMLAHFSGPGSFTPAVPWTLLAGPADAAAFAERVEAAPLPAGGGSTALGSCVVAAVDALDRCPWRATRRTVDLVSNGFNNAGTGPLSARGYAQAAGVTVNALVILDEYAWLESYYRDTVMAGEGAFVMVADGPASFAQALRAKLVAEIV